MNYSMTCTCGHVMTVDAMDEAEAKTKMMAVGKEHMSTVHPEMTMTDADAEKMVNENMKPA